MPKIVTFATLKGGVGKTMLCFNLAGILAQTDHRVLVIDSDLQGNLTNNMGVDRTIPNLKTTYDIYNTEAGQPNPEELVLKGTIPLLPTLDVIPGSIFLHKAEFRISTMAGRELVLSHYFEDNKDFFEQYEYILIDTNPSMSMINQNAFLASDSILLISDVSMNSLEGAQLFIALWEETRKQLRRADNIKGFIINDYDKRNKLSTDFLEYIKTDEELSDIRQIMMKTIIPRNIKLTESELEAKPISIYDLNSKGCVAIAELADELMERGIL